MIDYRTWTKEQLNAEIIRRLPNTRFRYIPAFTDQSGKHHRERDLSTLTDFANNIDSAALLMGNYIPRLPPDQIVGWWHLHDRLYGKPRPELEFDPVVDCVLFLTWLDEHPNEERR